MAGKHTYLVGCSYESEDVHRRVGPHVVTEQRVEMRDGRQGAVFVGHTVQVPWLRHEPAITGKELECLSYPSQTVHLKSKTRDFLVSVVCFSLSR